MLSLNTLRALRAIINSDRIKIAGNERMAFNKIDVELAAEEAAIVASQKEASQESGKS